MEALKGFEPSKAGAYNPGQIIILFDNRHFKGPNDKMSTLQSYWMDAKYRLGWPSLQTPNLEPGKIRLIWYTHAGNEGSRDFALWQAYAVKDMFDSLSMEAFRPMVIGWSAENPFPMIGGSEPPPKPKQEVVKVAKTYSGAVSGHGAKGTTPHDRVMAIIEQEEEEEAKKRREEVESARLASSLGYGEGAA